MIPALASLNLRRAAVLAAIVVATTVAAPPSAAADTLYLDFDNNGLEALGHGWAYEGWLIVNGAPVSTGTFTIGAGGEATPARFAVEVDDAMAATTFVLTIEPVPDMDTMPSAVHVLAGDLSGGSFELTAGHPAALGDDFTTAKGPYILNAPSGGDMAVYGNGIWWLDPATGPGATLELPSLPEGWAFEGWVVGPDGPLSTGRFVDSAAVDSDGQGITGGPYAAPPFPGQDLVVPPLDLTSGYAAVLSIEPEPDTSAGPFAFKPLVDMNIDDVGAGILQAMENNAGAFPTATVSVAEAMDATTTAHLMLSFEGLEDLGADAAYEGWLIDNGAPVSTGIFTVSGGVPSATYFPTEVSSLDNISAFVLTIEPVPDSDPGPSAVHILAGDVVGDRAALAVSHAAALGTDFSQASAAYILNTPSSGGTAPYGNGIWWLDPEAGPGATLELPSLPEGWVYEGWVVGGDGPVSTGRFTMAAGEDSDGAGPAGGADAFPPFPGQDFVDPARDLTDSHVAVISVEPDPDNSSAPFTLKPLMDPVIDDVGAGVLQPMHLNPAAMPSGAVVIAMPRTVVAGASTDGVDGARWITDLDLANDGASAASVLVQLLASNQANPMPETVALSLGAGQAMRYVDIYAELFGIDGTGALRVLSDSDAVRATSRSYADGEDGTYGQGIPAMDADQVLSYGEVGRLLQLAQDEDFRTNVGFVNNTAASIQVHLELFAADGSMVDSIALTLSAFEHQQLNQVITADVSVGWARVWTSTPGGSFFAYASVVDNGVHDPTFINPL